MFEVMTSTLPKVTLLKIPPLLVKVQCKKFSHTYINQTQMYLKYNVQELLTLPEHLSSMGFLLFNPQFLLCTILSTIDCPFSFGHCIVHPISNYYFCLSLWYFQPFFSLCIKGDLIRFDFWCLTPLSTILQLYHSDQFQWWKKPEDQERTTDHGQAIGKLYHLRLRVKCTLFVIYKHGCEPTLYW